MPQSRRFALSHRAVADLDEIYDYSAEQWSVDRAERYLLELRSSFQKLANGEQIGRDAELGTQVMRLVVQRHVVFYQLDKDSVLILRVLHSAMDALRHLEP